MPAFRKRAAGALLLTALFAGFAPAAPPDSLAASPRLTWTATQAAHLLRRAGFGGSPEDIRRLTRIGRDSAVDHLVDYEKIEQTCPHYPADRLLSEPPRRQFAGLDEQQRMRLQRVVRQLGQSSFGSLQDWWLKRMAESPRPLEEKMTLFWHGHFTSGFREVRRAGFMHRQNEFLRRNALGDFRTLLMGISRDPAMLIYLDNGRNVKRRPNENFARELMELFTMGEGNYSEQDVKEAARAFTGWTADRDGEFIVRSGEHDAGSKVFLGRTGNFDGDDIINIILEQPATARFLALKLCRFFVAPEPDQAMVEAVADELRLTDYDLRETMRTLFRSDMFYESRHQFALIRSPAELMVSTARMMEVPLEDLRMANQAMSQMGQELFQPPNVKGWDGQRSWITTSTLFLRYNTVKGLLEGTPGRARNDRPAVAALAQRNRRGRNRVSEMEMSPSSGGEMEMTRPDGPLARMAGEMDGLPEATREWLSRLELPPQFSAAQPAYDPLPVLEQHRLRSAENVVDHYVQRLLGMPLSRDRRSLLIDALEPGDERFDARSPAAPARVRGMIHLIMSMPEYQLN